MTITFHQKTGEFHLFNDKISYVIKILENGHIGNLYYGKRLNDRQDFSHLLEGGRRSLAVYNKENEYFLSQQHTKMEYPCFGTGDFRYPAYTIRQADGSRITSFRYNTHKITRGKSKPDGLPAIYLEAEDEAETLEIVLRDQKIDVEIILTYTVYRDYPVITKYVRFHNSGSRPVVLERALSACVDLPDAEFEMISLEGAWARERHVRSRKLEQGIQGVYSMRGASSAEHNPFIALKRPDTTEHDGEVYGFSLIYSGNHIEQVEVDTHNITRVLLGIHPDTFEWCLEPGQLFDTPEAVCVYAEGGLNEMSQVFHRVYAKRLVRGYWRDRLRPILINNWEATGPDFTHDQIVALAEKGAELGIELFVLDDGWFGNRDDDLRGLGDWHIVNERKLPKGIGRLAEEITALGMRFGVWIEPEMVNRDSDLYRSHPDWLLGAPGRELSPSRNQYVLDYCRKEVVDYIYEKLSALLTEAPITYIKWDMNRYITECHSTSLPPERQGEVYHRYILGVYELYERLTAAFPEVLFESCSSGGARFDPGMLYCAPQVWTSDNTDAVERIKIQYGTSYIYPLASIGAHVSQVPNQQTDRVTSIETRGNVAMFGVFGYELNLNACSETELNSIREQILFVKKHRKLIQQGTFYRLLSPFENDVASWIVVSANREEALAGYYQIHGQPNAPWERLKLSGLDENKRYCVNEDISRSYYGDELMYAGIPVNHFGSYLSRNDYASTLYYIREVKKEK